MASEKKAHGVSMSNSTLSGLTAGQQAVGRAEAAVAAAAVRPLLDVQHRSTTVQREGYLERLYTDYAELNRQREEVSSRKRQMDFDMYESNQQDIHELLFANVESADAALGDWDTWERVEAVVKRYAYGRSCHNAAEKKDMSAMQSRIDALTQVVGERSATVQSLTLNFDAVQQELAGVLKLLRLKDNEIHTLSNQNNTAMLQLRCLQRECTALRGLRDVEEAPAIKEDLRFLIEANKNLEKENQQLRRRLNARDGGNSVGAAVPALRGTDELASPITTATDATAVSSPPPIDMQEGDLDRCLEDDAYRRRFLKQRIPLSGAVVDAKREAETWKLRLEAEVRRTMELLDRDAMEMDELVAMPMDRGGQMGVARIEDGVFTSYATYQAGNEKRLWRDSVPVVSAPPLPAVLPVIPDAAAQHRPFALGTSISASPRLFAAAEVVAKEPPAAPVQRAKLSVVGPPSPEDRKRRSVVTATKRRRSVINGAAATKKSAAAAAAAIAVTAGSATQSATTTKVDPGNGGKTRRGQPIPPSAAPPGTGGPSGGRAAAVGGTASPVAPRTTAAAATAPAPVKALRSAVLQCAELSRANALRRELLHVQWLRQQLLDERKGAATLAAVQAETAAQLAAATKMMAIKAPLTAASSVPAPLPRGERQSVLAKAPFEEAAEESDNAGATAASRLSESRKSDAEMGFVHFVPPILVSDGGRSDVSAPLHGSSSLLSAPERLRHVVQGSRPSTLSPELAVDGGEVEGSHVEEGHTSISQHAALLGDGDHGASRAAHSPGVMTTTKRVSPMIGGQVMSQQGAGLADPAFRRAQTPSSRVDGEHGNKSGTPPLERAGRARKDTAAGDDGTYASWLRAQASELREEMQALRSDSVTFGNEVQEALRLLSDLFGEQHAEARRAAEAETAQTMQVAAQEAMEEAAVARVTQLLEERFGAKLPDDFEAADVAPLPDSATDEQWLSHELRLAAFAMVRETVQSHADLGGVAGAAGAGTAAAGHGSAAEQYFENDIMNPMHAWVPSVMGTAKRWKEPTTQSNLAGALANFGAARGDKGTAGDDVDDGLQLRGKGMHSESPRHAAVPPAPAQWYWHTRGPAAVPAISPHPRGAPAATGGQRSAEMHRTAAFAGPTSKHLWRAPTEPVSLQPTVLRYKLGDLAREEQRRVNAQVQSAAAIIYEPSFEGFVREYILPVVTRASQVGHGATMDPALRAAVRQLREQSRQRNKDGVRLLFDRVANNIRTRHLLRRNVYQGQGFASYIGVMYNKWRGRVEKERREIRARQQNRHAALLALLNLATPAAPSGGAAPSHALRRPAPQQSGAANGSTSTRMPRFRAQRSSYHFDQAHFDKK